MWKCLWSRPLSFLLLFLFRYGALWRSRTGGSGSGSGSGPGLDQDQSTLRQSHGNLGQPRCSLALTTALPFRIPFSCSLQRLQQTLPPPPMTSVCGTASEHTGQRFIIIRIDPTDSCRASCSESQPIYHRDLSICKTHPWAAHSTQVPQLSACTPAALT